MGEDLEPTSDSAVPAPIQFDFDYAPAPAPESTSIVSIADEYGLFIGGEFVDALSERSFTTLSPQPARPRPRCGVRYRVASGPSTCTGSPASSKSGRASSP